MQMDQSPNHKSCTIMSEPSARHEYKTVESTETAFRIKPTDILSQNITNIAVLWKPHRFSIKHIFPKQKTI